MLVYNLLLMAVLALTGWAFCLLVWRWTGNGLAAVTSGSLAAFNPAIFTNFPQIQGLHLEFFAMTLVALDRLLRVPRVRRTASLAGWFALQALTSGYWLVLTTVALLASAGTRWRPVRGTGDRRALAVPVAVLGRQWRPWVGV